MVRKYITTFFTALLLSCGSAPAPAQTISPEYSQMQQSCMDTTTSLVQGFDRYKDPKFEKQLEFFLEDKKDGENDDTIDWFIRQMQLAANMHDSKMYGKLVFESCMKQFTKQTEGI